MANYTMATLGKWAEKSQARVNAIVKGSTQEVCVIAQTPIAKGGRLPIDTGNLRNSFQSSLNGSTALTGGESYVMVAGRMKAGDVAQFGWSAVYGSRQNYGFVGEDSLGRNYNQQGKHFLEGATMQWQMIVAGQVAKAQRAVEGGA